MARKKKKDPLKEVVENVWPKTKKELEKGMKNAKEMLNKGEKYLKGVSDKGVEKTKKISLTLKREKLFYDLGKAAATTATNKWNSSKKIQGTLKEIKDLSREIKKIK
jgi:hypothetical protein